MIDDKTLIESKRLPTLLDQDRFQRFGEAVGLPDNKYVELYELAPIAYFVFNADGLIVDVNQAGLQLLGIKKAAVVNRCFSRFIVPESLSLFSDFRERVLKTLTEQTCELKLLRWSGPAFYAEMRCKVAQIGLSGQKQLLTVVTDISAQKATEEAMHLTRIKMASIDRMRSMNELIYSIAHHQNHALAVMNNYIYGCIRRLETDADHGETLLQALKKVAQQSRELSDIILRMKNFTAKGIFRYEVTNISTIIHDMLALIHYEILEFPVTMHYEGADHLPAVKLDKLHIQQVILNLARNAIEAMRDACTTEPKLEIEVRLINESSIHITMLDNGPGFDPHLTSTLFEPHFTTKPYAVGLGLTVSRTIIEKHGGQLIAEANASGGACFHFTLPCVSLLP